MSTPSGSRTTVVPQTSSGARATGFLQRKCRCGSSKSPLDDTCEACRSKALQRKLVVGASDDRFEIEADRIASHVLGDVAASGASAVHRAIGRAVLPHGGDAPTAPASVERAIAGVGAPLGPTLRHEMERRFGFDFSQVRVHVGADAEQSAREVNAAAYTVGRDVVFGSGYFAPTTRAGRRLLAHELTHVVQQGAAARLGTLQARMQPPSVAAAGPRVQREPRIEVGEVKVVPKYEIRWAYVWLVRDRADPALFDVQLYINLKSEDRRKQLSTAQMAEGGVATLEQFAGLKFTEDGRKRYMDKIESRFADEPYSDSYVFSVSDAGIGWRAAFDPASYKAHLDAVLAEPGRTLRAEVFAEANFALDEPPAKHSRQPERWVQQAVDGLEARLRDLRKQKDHPTDLPDRLVLWYNERNRSWYLNVWVYYDTRGKIKTRHAIRLKEGETLDALYERAREAVHTAVDETAAAEQQQREREEMPEWALRLKAGVEKALGHEKTRDVPDGMSLTREGRGAQTKGPGGAASDTATAASAEVTAKHVLLRIWVEQKSERSTRRNAGSVPLVPETTLEKLVPYVRSLTAMLREFEAIPDGAAVKPWETAGAVTLPPFDAKIMPLDLRGDRITVQDARNKFSMFLDFERQYQSGPGADLYIASKLYNQAIFFHWKVFPAPPEVRPLARKGEVEDWSERWKFLYDHYNPGGLTDGDLLATHTAGSVAPPSTSPVYDETEDITTRVSLEGAPGEYLVYCETRHAPIDDAGLKRVSSYAYYPVLTKSKEALTTPLVTQTTEAITAADADLQNIDALLAAEHLEDNQKNLLLEARASTRAQRKVLETKETRGLAETTEAEIIDGKARLLIVKQLKEVLPGVLAKAQANADAHLEPSAPSKLLADRPKLLNMYWQLVRESKTVTAYERELEAQLKELGKISARAVDFQKNMKSDPNACVYSPEAVFLSELDGHTYPLVLMIGEARPAIPGMRVAYIVADVTSSQTQREYRGESVSTGPEGHIEAIDRAFGEFGDKATYGTGWIAVRMPRGPREECLELHKGGIQTYRSKEGILEKVWKALGFIAAVVGVAALVATGFGAPAAAALLGVAAGVLGAAISLRNISERSAKHTLAFDAELGMDIIGVLGVGELVAAGRLATLSRTVRGFQTYERLHNVLAIYRVTAEVTSAVLIPVKLVEDIDKIKALGLSKAEEDALIREAWTGAIEGGLMFLASSVGARAMGGGGGEHGPIIDDSAGIRQQAELMALENAGGYKSMQDKGWVDAHGHWTAEAPEPVRRKLTEPPAGEPTGEHTGPSHAKPTELPPVEPRPGGAPTDAQLEAAANAAVDRVNHHETTIDGEPGQRHADLDDGHKIVEVETAGGGLGCEYQSGKGKRVACPVGMGDAQVAPAPSTEEPQPKKSGVPTTEAPQGPTATGEGGHRAGTPELVPKNLIEARQKERYAERRRDMLEANRAADQERLKELESKFIPEREARIKAYLEKHPKAGPDDPKLKEHLRILGELEADAARRESQVKRVGPEIDQLKQDLADLAALKQQYEGSKPWRKVSLTDPDARRPGLAGELEMSTGMQGEGCDPLGKTVRAEEIVIPEDFDAAFDNWKGKTGIDGIYKRKNPETGEIEYWVGESKTTGDPSSTDPTGTRGALDTMKSGERQLSDRWIGDRLKKSGLSRTDIDGIKAAMAANKLKKFYALTDHRGTKFYEVTNVSAVDVKIGGEVKF